VDNCAVVATLPQVEALGRAGRRVGLLLVSAEPDRKRSFDRSDTVARMKDNFQRKLTWAQLTCRRWARQSCKEDYVEVLVRFRFSKNQQIYIQVPLNCMRIQVFSIVMSNGPACSDFKGVILCHEGIRQGVRFDDERRNLAEISDGVEAAALGSIAA
jgi:hypothetical protein